MPKPRRSLRDRDQDAITAAEAEEPAPGLEDEAPARVTTPKRRTTPVPQVRTETTTRIGALLPGTGVPGRQKRLPCRPWCGSGAAR